MQKNPTKLIICWMNAVNFQGIIFADVVEIENE